MDIGKVGKALKLELTADNAEQTIIDHCLALSKGVSDLKAQLVKPTVDETMLALCRDNRNMKLAALVSAAKITPDVQAKLAVLFVSDEALSLSLTQGRQGDFDKLIEALSVNDPVKLTEQTGPQLMKLSDPSKGEDKSNAMERETDRCIAEAKGFS